MNNLLYEGLGLGVSEFALGLSLELRLTELHRNNRRQALTNVLPREVDVLFLEHIPLTRKLVDQQGQRGAEPLLVRATFGGVDRVGEGVDGLGISAVPLHRNLCG